MNRRKEILHELIRFEQPSFPLIQELEAFGWDWPEEPLVTLTREDVLRIIERFLGGEITAMELQEWAENIELREDVEFGEQGDQVVDDVFFRLATPFINVPLTAESVGCMKHELLTLPKMPRED
jgi:hypothetical protein